MIYGYSRVSTAGQQAHGNSLEDQKAKLLAAGAEVVYADAFTGKTMDRPEFSKLMQDIQPGDTLIVTKLDRLSRTATDGVQIVQDLLKRDIVVNVLNMGKCDSTPMGKLMLTMLLAFAEFERDMIIERTQTGKDVAREKGIRVDGRPEKYTPEKIKLAMTLLDGGNSYKSVERMTGISKSTLIRKRREYASHEAI